MNQPASVSSVVLLAVLLLLLLVSQASGRWTGETGEMGETGETGETAAEGRSQDGRELLIVLQNVLEKLQSRKFLALDRRQSRLPTCEVGASCSVKKGPRFGQLCDCQRGSRCNFFFLKCL